MTVEINGVQHLELLAKEADDLRRARLAIGGRLVVEPGSYTVRHRNDLAVLTTADALMSRGWQPPRPAQRRLAALAARHPDWHWSAIPA